jgi:hypothetical protein
LAATSPTATNKMQTISIRKMRGIHETRALNKKLNQSYGRHLGIIPQHLNTSTPQHLNTSTPQHLNTSTPQHLNTSTPQHLNTHTSTLTPQHPNSLFYQNRWSPFDMPAFSGR